MATMCMNQMADKYIKYSLDCVSKRQVSPSDGGFEEFAGDDVEDSVHDSVEFGFRNDVCADDVGDGSPRVRPSGNLDRTIAADNLNSSGPGRGGGLRHCGSWRR